MPRIRERDELRGDRRLVFITQQVDPGHPALGATVDKIAALAARLDEVVVLADGAVPDALPANCRVRTFGAPVKALRGARFAAALALELARRPRPGAVLAHMCPIYAVLAAPLVQPLRVRLLLWFTHWHASPTLRAAEKVVDDVVSVDRRSFPLDSDKVTAVGHGIDTAGFACRPAPPASPRLQALMLGRYSEAKGIEPVLRAVALARGRGLDVELDVHGPALNAAEERHRAELESLVARLELAEHVRLGDAVPRAGVPRLLGDADVVVNNMRAGAPDKAVYEAAAACVPVLASNPVFDELLGGLAAPLRFEREEPETLAARLEGLSALDRDARGALGAELRRRVEERHSVESWADGILRVAGL